MKLKKVLAVLISAFILISVSAFSAFAFTPTDEITDFTIVVDVNEDASLNMKYHIEWKVLDDELYGPLSWVNLGMPNGNHWKVTSLSDTIDSIEEDSVNLKIYLDREYYAGETVSFDLSFVQDNLYQIDKYGTGETVYSFTPAWFDEINVDNLTIRWNRNSASQWQPDCIVNGDYLEFSKCLSAGEKYNISVYYPGDSFGFSPERSADSYTGDYYEYDDSDSDVLSIILGLIVFLAFMSPFAAVIITIIGCIKDGVGLKSKETVRKITRTKIEYYETCPGCGAAHEEGSDNCKYCGRSMIKNKEVVTEDQIEHPEKYSTNGTYRYSGSPNTYIHVNVVNVPAPRTVTRSGSSSSCAHSSCVHSSCAHSSCACASHCACACACASSGRAGCSVKNFFNVEKHNKRISVDSGSRKERSKA